MLHEVVETFIGETGATIVEAAHMELAEPTIAQAFQKCIDRGAKQIVIHPYFLAPGRHSSQDIPDMAKEAAQNHPSIPYFVSNPLGVDSKIAAVIQQRISEALGS